MYAVDNNNYFGNTNWDDNNPDSFSYDELYENAEISSEMLMSDILAFEASEQEEEAWPTFTYTEQRVTDILIPAQLSWGSGSKILISGSMSCGKTSFAIDYLNHVTAQTKEKVLYLTSRFGAREQVKKHISTNVDVRNYRTLIKGSSYWKDKGQGIYFTGRSCLDDYKYIIVDDFHCIFSDSSFIGYTDMLLNYLLHKCSHAVVVFLTSYPRIFNDYLNSNNLQICCHYQFILTSPYQHFKCWSREKDILEVLSQLPADEKALCFCTKDQAEKWKNSLIKEYKIPDGNIACIVSKVIQDEDEDDKTLKIDPIVKEIINDSKFSSQILFVTNSAISYGINIFDEAVMHIIVDKADPDYACNVIGRRRITKGGTIPNLYVRQRSLSYHLRELKKDRGIIELYRNDFKSFFHKYKRRNIDELIYPLPRFDSDAPIVEYIVNKVTEQVIESNIAYYEYILSQGELNLAKEIGYCLSSLSITPFGSYVTLQESQQAKIELIAYLETLLGKKLFKEDIPDITAILRKVMREPIKRTDKDGINKCFVKKTIPFQLVWDEKYRVNVLGKDGKTHSKRYSLLEKNVLLSTPPVIPIPPKTNPMDIIDVKPDD